VFLGWLAKERNFTNWRDASDKIDIERHQISFMWSSNQLYPHILSSCQFGSKWAGGSSHLLALGGRGDSGESRLRNDVEFAWSRISRNVHQLSPIF